MIEVRRFVTDSGADVVGQWLADLNDERARARINARIARMAAGNFGDCKSLGAGLFELRIDYGPGYRVYFARIGPTIVLLLCGGDKRRQSADIAQAMKFLGNYHKRDS
ncbi:MAG TPA: type II toxin-antitoxin system RelE/ParE family toxin [Humisphaera sp.]|nr:type II toxin-antitoxin system RelE/ParE family toxin [Humisphaera sp.]